MPLDPIIKPDLQRRHDIVSQVRFLGTNGSLFVICSLKTKFVIFLKKKFLKKIFLLNLVLKKSNLIQVQFDSNYFLNSILI